MTILTPFIRAIRSLLIDSPAEEDTRAVLIDLMLAMSKVDTGDATHKRRFRITRPGADLYYLDGKITHSKIYAIKYVRGLEGGDLQTVKNYIEALPAVCVEGEI